MTRFGTTMVTYFSVMGVVITAFIPTQLRLVWNVSASVPVGLYSLSAPRDLAGGDLVAVMPEKALADFLVERGYIGRGAPLLKRVMGLPGQQVCRTGNAIIVDAVRLGDALDRDRMGRVLPTWQGCRRIAAGEIFLMNPAVRDSLDGRYFGSIPARAVIGIAMPLLTDEAGDGHFSWRAATR
ncbi:S26 family signal peptidase [Mesorhizobium sp. BR1-1-16]|uniref:S26 family signal peptidase n=1 Tax=Mesorhizobium sp. BR1-1-16 TaxID=2876653 RepID=UPI001CCEFC25|nr:S26 family signal peptidase [Mesorhizobium sp. BR1-1-16]MBZ9937026.1 S26 family signal peptidase [Mesorhizobium sp. BR1-1-16]